MKQFEQDRRQAAKQTVIIISAEKDTRTDESNMLRTIDLETKLNENDIVFKKALGSYKGSTKKSFVCYPINTTEELLLHDLAFNQFTQESILYRDISGVYLVYIGDTVRIGNKLKAVSQAIAKQHDSYTDVDDRYFIVQ